MLFGYFFLLIFHRGFSTHTHNDTGTLGYFISVFFQRGLGPDADNDPLILVVQGKHTTVSF